MGGEEMKRSKLLRALTGVLLVVILAACAPAATPTPAGPKVITFGCAVEMTGIKATEGGAMKDGMDLWVDWVNDHGGINVGGEKYNVEVIYYDDESDPETAAKLTEKLITEHNTKLLFGPYSSAITIATAAIGEKYQALTVAPLANSGTIYAQGYKYVYSVLPPAANYLRLLIEMAKDLDPKPETAVVLAMDDPFGISCAEGTRDWAEAAGIEVLLYEKYPPDSKDLSSLLTKVKGLNPDMILASTQFQQATLLTRQMKELNVCAPLVGFTVGPNFPEFIESLGPDADAIMCSEWWLPTMSWSCPVFGSAAEWTDLFMDRYDYYPSYHAASGSAAGVLYQLAIEKAGSLDVDKIRDALAGLDVEIFWGPHAFDENGQNIKGGSAPIQIQNGELLAVYPDKLAQADPIYPFPCWDER
jgi:branched-chain amino acid transport system substrate-binding protein